MQELLHERAWDLILSDHHFPTFSAPQALGILHEQGLDIPFIIVSGSMQTSVVVSCLKAGAHDFIIKGEWLRLVPAVNR
ncbi:MAG: response regulator [Mariprofundaceae bacterium]|nr:response regulator [Mariprofundaceae bacterium]